MSLMWYEQFFQILALQEVAALLLDIDGVEQPAVRDRLAVRRDRYVIEETGDRGAALEAG